MENLLHSKYVMKISKVLIVNSFDIAYIYAMLGLFYCHMMICNNQKWKVYTGDIQIYLQGISSQFNYYKKIHCKNK